jgi:hypothetical protein
MLTDVTVARALYHHCQDTGTDCGRASAQMVISSLVQSPPPGSAIGPPGATTPVPVTQATLQCREKYPVDDTTKPSWYTYPDELRDLLKGAPEITAPADKKWRIANHGTLDELLADIVLSLESGMPSVINIEASDHWVVVVGAKVDAGNALQAILMRDPMPADPRPHTYIDGCNDAANGESYADPWQLSRTDLGSYDLEIGNVPPPPGMPSYAGRYIAIINGDTPSTEVLQKKRARLRPNRRPPIKPEVPVMDPAKLLYALAGTAKEWSIAPLTPLLGLDPAVRLVNDIDGSESQYILLSLFDHHKQRGAMAVFNPDGSVKHLRFMTNVRMDATLRNAPSREPLWWTSRPLPTLPSPYFPFARSFKPGGPATYQRLFDGHEIPLSFRRNV